MKLSSKALVGIALGLSLVTSGLVYNYLVGVSQKPPANSVPVVVAKADIPPKTRITADMVQVSYVPENYMQPGAVRDANHAIGMIVREQIVAGEQISDRRLVIEGKTMGFTGIIPRDKRAVSLAINEVSGVAGFVKAGDHVDVIATFDKGVVGDDVSHIILQNVLVLAYNRDSETAVAQTANKEQKDKEKEVVKTSTVTLAVSPEEAAQIAIAEDKGRVRLALRPFMPGQSLVITNTVTPKDLVGTHESPVKEGSSAPAPKEAPPADKPRPSADGKGIQLIRGTKAETVPIN